MLITVSLTADDYSGKISEAIKDYSKKANIKGFRKGMVPAGVIKKMYGKELLADELNKQVNEHLGKYLKDEKIKILGDPLPQMDELLKLDIDAKIAYDFTFELGLQPEINLDLQNKKLKLNRYKIKTDEKLVTEEIDRLRKNFGKMSNPDTIEEDDILYVELLEMKNKDEAKEGGIKHSATIPVSEFKSGKIRKDIMALKKGESVVLNLLKSLTTDKSIIADKYLHVDEKMLDSAEKEFTLTLTNINRIAKAELNQEFFDKIYGPGNIENIEAFKKRVAEELEGVLANTTNRKLNTDIVAKLLDEVKVDLPEDFLKRWLKATNDQGLSDEEMETEIEPFMRNLKWSLIVNKIIESNDIHIHREEIEAHTRELVKLEYGFNEDDEMSKKYLDELVGHVLKNEEHVKNSYDNLRDKKVFDYLQNNLTIKTKEINYNDFKDLK